MSGLSEHGKGFLMTLVGVMVLTPDTLLIRLADMPPLTMLFWRSILMSLTLYTIVVVIYRKRSWQAIRGIGWHGVFIACFYSLGSLGFIMSLEFTTAANTLIIVSSSPLFAALFSMIFLKEKLALATWVAILTGMVGIIIVMAEGIKDLSFAGPGFLGSLFALLTAIGMAAAFTLTRQRKDINMVPATALGGLITSIALIGFVNPLLVTEHQWPLLLTLGLFVLPVSFGLISLGPRYIPAPEVGLLMLLETVLGPLWVWLVVHEEPSATALLGGSIVVGTLLLHSVYQLRRVRAVALSQIQ